MRRIINGKAYDTQTGTCVAQWSNGHYTNDFCYCSEDLYRTPRGGWFLHCEGGAMSAYASTSGNNRGYGEHIRPMTPDQALAWLEQHDFAGEIEKYFGKVDDADDSDGYDFKLRGIPSGIHEKIKAEAEKTGRSMNELMFNLIVANFK